MIITRYLPEYFPQVETLCNKYGVNVPLSSDVWLAIDDKNKVVALIGLRNVAFIEPLISENPLAGKKLYDKAEEFLKHNHHQKLIRCFTKSENEELFTKIGFKRSFNDYIIMEKILK